MANTILVGDNDKFIENKYAISELYMMIDRESYELPVERVRSFKIENYYTEAIFPILKLNILLESSRYYLMIKNKNKVKFKLRVQTYSHNVGEPENKSMYKDIINDVFVFYPEESGDDFDKDLRNAAGTGDKTNDLSEITNEIELFLFKDSVVTGLRSQINLVLNNVNMTTTALYLLSTAGLKNILMSPMDNTTVYNNLILPPLSIEKQIHYLESTYGFYKNGMIFFVGLLNTYLISYDGKCTAYKRNEWTDTVIYVMEKSNTQSSISSSIKKFNENRFYINLPSNNLVIENRGITDNAISGIDATIIDSSNNSSNDVVTGISTIGNANKRILFNDVSNPYLSNIYRIRESSENVVMTFSVQNINMESFEPNKSVSMIFESPTLNSKYQGNYVVVSASHIFTGNNQMYELTSFITLKKI